MVKTIYNREKAVEYAQKWALSRNPQFYDFDSLGGDCTNFISQCIYSGAGIMNFAPTFGWFYNSLNDRAPSWTSVEYLYNFITTNRSVGPFGEKSTKDKLEIGDLIQMQIDEPFFHHTTIISKISNDEIYVCAHTNDSKNRILSSYLYTDIRFIHILGARKWE